MRFLALFSALASVIYGTSVCVNQNCAPKNLVADFVFLIDVSEALSQDDFNAVQQLLLNMSTSLTIGPTASQMAIYTYATRVRSAGLLKDLNTLSALQQAIGGLQYDATEDRVLQQAISQEETDVTAANGFRANAKKVLVIIEGDEFTGQSPFNRQLDTVRAKFDMILVVGVGEQAIRNNYENTKKLAGDKTDVFWAYNTDHLPYAQLWIQNNACANSHVPPTTPMPTTVPTPNPSVPCPVTTPNFDVYLIVDTSTSITPTDFSTLKQQILSFVSVYPLGDSNVNFGLVTISLDAQLYYTGFHANQNRKQLLSTLGYLTQDASNGQTLALALRAINSTFLVQNYPTPNKLVVYLSGNTNFDQDPTALSQSIASTYGVHFVAVKWNAGADTTKLSTLTGGANCVFDATTKRDQTATWLQTQLCTKQFCR
ncbi:unnamed protein product, partial [Mesorhabditis belari]|uniref:VWFA domain-containing protein n=1 Tax=Mesorhabditis belari TaxID=2138241 RepID=A0AAF3EA18_9BILA